MTEEDQEMREKLAHLLHHWIEHNEAHAEGYGTWAERAEKIGRDDVAREIRAALELSREMNRRFVKARELLKGGNDV